MSTDRVVIALYDKNYTILQLKNMQKGIHWLIEAGLSVEDFLLARVGENSVFKRSDEVKKKGFPLFYFIQLGPTSLMNLTQLEDVPLVDIVKMKNTQNIDKAEGWFTAFFSGSEIIEDVKSIKDFLETRNFDQPDTPLELDLPSAHALVGSAASYINWASQGLRWGVAEAYNVAANLMSPKVEDERESEFIVDDIEPFDAVGSSEEDMEPEPLQQDVPVLRSNWYGRIQKRTYRFAPEFFSRLDELDRIKALFHYEDIQGLMIEKSDTFEEGHSVEIRFKKSAIPVQYIYANAQAVGTIVSMILQKNPSISVSRNLETKLSKLSASTIVLKLSVHKVHQHPRFSKDGLSIAYEDQVGWCKINLEEIDVEPADWWAYDPSHYPEEFVKQQITLPIVRNSTDECFHMIATDELEQSYHQNYFVEMVKYNDLESNEGIRTTSTGNNPSIGFVVEVLRKGHDSVLFFSTKRDFRGEWKMKHMQLKIIDKRVGPAVVSPDGRYMAFCVDDFGIVVHKIGEKLNLLYITEHDVNMNEVVVNACNDRLSLSTVIQPEERAAFRFS